jgi:anti-sigma B factor antagonist
MNGTGKGTQYMQISVEEIDGGLVRVILDGRMDIVSAPGIDAKLSAIADSKQAVMLDMRNVSFIGSTGVRSLIAPAQRIKTKGGRMVMFGPNEMVEKVLRASNIESLIPIHHEFQSAVAALH